MDFLIPVDIVIITVVVGRKNSLLNVGLEPQGRSSINILKVLSFEGIKLLICGQKNVYEGLMQDTIKDPQYNVVS
jgi:hypothetical protein